MTTSYEADFPAGFVIEGIWNRGRYVVERKLGQGANGTVYLVRSGTKRQALKIGCDSFGLQSEINMLRELSRLPGSFHKFLADVDDCGDENGVRFPFYVMKFVRGQEAGEFLRGKRQGTGGRESGWIAAIGVSLLNKLAELHRAGYVFGDLKRENILVTPGGEAELVDFGGVTAKGKAIKQFTEIYDRGYWHAGGRNADERYDLFSFAILCMLLVDEGKAQFVKQLLPQNRTVEVLLAELDKDLRFKPWLPFLRKALQGEFPSAEAALAEWRRAVFALDALAAIGAGSSKGSWITAGFALSLFLFVLTLLLFR